MKKAIFALVLSALFAVSMVLPASAWFHPGPTPTDDRLHSQFGPMTPNLLITPYGSYPAEFAAFHACDIDIMDWPLDPEDYHTLRTEDPNMEVYATPFYVDRGMREFDLNNKRFPTNDVWFRKALAYAFGTSLKQRFVAEVLEGMGLVMDSPLAWSAGWYNPYCTNLYPYDLQAAVDTLVAHGYYDHDGDEVIEGPNGEEFTLIFYARQDDPIRTTMGQWLYDRLASKTAAATIYKCTWPEGKGPAVMSIDLRIAPKTECFQKVMVEFDYHIYTGGWGFGRDPDTLYFLYLSDYAQAFPYTPNYPGYQNPEFDEHARGMLTAEEIGDPETPCTAKYHVFEMQRILMDDAGVIPVFTFAGYGAYKVGWEKVVNAEGTGPASWFTFLNTYKTGTDTIRWGFMNDVEELNPIHSSWVWDWNILGLVYDTLINVDPYDMSRDKPWLAYNWTLGTWTYEGETCTYIEFKLREDVYWHDIPPKPDRKTPGGKPLLPNGAFNVPVTADDVVASIYIVRDIPDSWNNALVADVVYAEALDPYTVRVYYGVYMPLWALHWVGGLPIIPKHVWWPVFLEGHTREFNAVAEKCLAGCGPWKFDYEASSWHNYYMLRANTRYFRYHPVDMYATFESPTGLKRVDPGSTVSFKFYLHNQDFQRNFTGGEFTITIKLIDPDGVETTLYTGTNPELISCKEVEIFSGSATCSKIGLYKVQATITPDSTTGHGDQDGYTIFLWSTIKEDLTLDFHVDIFDIVIVGLAFGAKPGDENWDPRADIAPEYGTIDIFDIVRIALKFGWPTA
jgi:peptide/nickel transport system substrate-binding protein